MAITRKLCNGGDCSDLNPAYHISQCCATCPAKERCNFCCEHVNDDECDHNVDILPDDNNDEKTEESN